MELSARHPFALLGLLIAGGLAHRGLRGTEHAEGAALSQLDTRLFRGRPWTASAAVVALLFDLVVLKAYYQHPTKGIGVPPSPRRRERARVLPDVMRRPSYPAFRISS